jgi:hypothetical protein
VNVVTFRGSWARQPAQSLLVPRLPSSRRLLPPSARLGLHEQRNAFMPVVQMGAFPTWLHAALMLTTTASISPRICSSCVSIFPGHIDRLSLAGTHFICRRAYRHSGEFKGTE